MSQKTIILLCIIILSSCDSKKEKFVLPESIQKIAIFELNNSFPEYDVKNDTVIVNPKYERVLGLIEIDRNFELKILKRSSYQGNYMFGISRTPDSLISAIMRTIQNFSRVDSIDLTENKDRIYDGYIYFMVIEKNNNDKILLGGIPDPISRDLNDISLFLRDSAHFYADKHIENQDSIKIYIRQYDKYRPKEYALPTLPSKEQLDIKFIPPQITDEY